IVSSGDRKIIQVFLMDDVSDADSGRGRHVADQQRTVRDAPAEVGPLLHVLIVDVGVAEVTGNAGEHDDVSFAYRLGKAIGVADLHGIQSGLSHFIPRGAVEIGTLCAVTQTRY